MKIKFPVVISNGATTTVTIDLSLNEANKLLVASEANQSLFSESEGLSELYTRVLEEAYKSMAESIKSDQAFLNYFLAGKYNEPRAIEVIKEMFTIEVLYPEL